MSFNKTGVETEFDDPSHFAHGGTLSAVHTRLYVENAAAVGDMMRQMDELNAGLAFKLRKYAKVALKMAAEVEEAEKPIKEVGKLCFC